MQLGIHDCLHSSGEVGRRAVHSGANGMGLGAGSVLSPMTMTKYSSAFVPIASILKFVTFEYSDRPQPAFPCS